MPLISLDLQSCKNVEGRGFHYIKDIPLQKLNISHTRIRSSDMEDFEVWKSSITELEIRDCKRFELEWVAGMHSIFSLNWSYNLWEDNSNPLEYLRGKVITDLGLARHVTLTDEWLESLRGMPL